MGVHEQTWLTGSRMYNLATPDSDYDYVSVFHSWDEYFDPFVRRDYTKNTHENNRTRHSLTKFLRLLEKGNFNTVDMVFYSPIQEDPEINSLIKKIKPVVLTENVATSYIGYIKSQNFNVLRSRGKGMSGERERSLAELGYDSKFAYHIFRGIYTLRGILETKNFHYLTDKERETILSVKTGEAPLDFVQTSLKTLTEELWEQYTDVELMGTGPFKEVVNEFFKEKICGFCT